MEFVDSERAEHEVYPSPDQVFNAFRLTAYEDTRVVILGQDPYHGPGQAHGLCFSVPSDLPKKPPSLSEHPQGVEGRRGRRAARRRLGGMGVVRVCCCSTRRSRWVAARPILIDGKGWERFTDGVLRAINEKDHRVVFILWGSRARRKKKLITNPLHRVIESAHPSPLSAYRGFFGSKPFSRTNELLSEACLTPIDWSDTRVGEVDMADR